MDGSFDRQSSSSVTSHEIYRPISHLWPMCRSTTPQTVSLEPQAIRAFQPRSDLAGDLFNASPIGLTFHVRRCRLSCFI